MEAIIAFLIGGFLVYDAAMAVLWWRNRAAERAARDAIRQYRRAAREYHRGER